MTNTEMLEQITRRIVEGFHPQRLILFGSRARGDERRDSDVDLLIVAPSAEPRWRRAVPVYRALAGLGVPKDIAPSFPAQYAGDALGERPAAALQRVRASLHSRLPNLNVKTH